MQTILQPVTEHEGLIVLLNNMILNLNILPAPVLRVSCPVADVNTSSDKSCQISVVYNGRNSFYGWRNGHMYTGTRIMLLLSVAQLQFR
jgi:hypothetical protein